MQFEQTVSGVFVGAWLVLLSLVGIWLAWRVLARLRDWRSYQSTISTLTESSREMLTEAADDDSEEGRRAKVRLAELDALVSAGVQLGGDELRVFSENLSNEEMHRYGYGHLIGRTEGEPGDDGSNA